MRRSTPRVHFSTDPTAPSTPSDAPWLVRGSPSPPHVPGFDLRSTEDFELVETVHSRAVTHTNFQPVLHHVRQELISRDVHRPEVFQRILPVRETIVRPARHFVVSSHDGKIVEVERPPAYVRTGGVNERRTTGNDPASTGDDDQREPSSGEGRTKGSASDARVADAGSSGVGQGAFWSASEPQLSQFSRKTTVHVYPPVVDDAARLRGLTQPCEIQVPGIRTDVMDDKKHPAKQALHEPMPGEHPNDSAPVSKSKDVTPWEFANGTEHKPDDPVQRGGHSIASKIGRDLLRRRASTKSSGGRTG